PGKQLRLSLPLKDYPPSLVRQTTTSTASICFHLLTVLTGLRSLLQANSGGIFRPLQVPGWYLRKSSWQIRSCFQNLKCVRPSVNQEITGLRTICGATSSGSTEPAVRVGAKAMKQDTSIMV